MTAVRMLLSTLTVVQVCNGLSLEIAKLLTCIAFAENITDFDLNRWTMK